MTKVYSIASQKGGSGKTSTAISIAACLARQGKRVLLVDMDSQANASKVLLPNYQRDIGQDDTVYRTIIERKPLPVHHTAVPDLWLSPSHILLSDTDVVLTTALDHRESRLKDQLDPIKPEYEYVFLDCPPALSWLTINALSASDEVIVVISPGYFELDSTVQIGKTIKEVQDNFNPRLKMRGFLFTMSDPTLNSKTSISLLRDSYPEFVLNTVIPRNVDLKDACMQKQDVFAYSPQCRAAEAFRRLVREVFE